MDNQLTLSHLAARELPRMNKNEEQQLRESLEENGFLAEFPILVAEGEDGERRIIDGTHRERISRELGIQPVYRVVDEAEADMFTFAANGPRRHLTKSALTMLVAARNPDATPAEIAAKVGVTRDMAQRAVRAAKDPEAVADAAAGEPVKKHLEPVTENKLRAPMIVRISPKRQVRIGRQADNMGYTNAGKLITGVIQALDNEIVKRKSDGGVRGIFALWENSDGTMEQVQLTKEMKRRP